MMFEESFPLGSFWLLCCSIGSFELELSVKQGKSLDNEPCRLQHLFCLQTSARLSWLTLSDPPTSLWRFFTHERSFDCSTLTDFQAPLEESGLILGINDEKGVDERL